MRIRCPYCDCHYDIHPDTLGNPIGSEKLGFGWWLRCYQCQKKFWLKSTTVINTGFAPIKADKMSMINRLSRICDRSRPEKLSKFEKKHRIAKHNGVLFVLIITLIIGGFCYMHINEIQHFLITRVNRFTVSTALGLQLSNIVYRIDKFNGQYRIIVMGNIINNTQSILQCDGLHIVVLNGNTEAISWTFVPNTKNIIPGDKLAFSTDRSISILPQNPKILVRIIN